MSSQLGNLDYHQGDERPAWEETVIENGTAPDFSTGYTFTVNVQDDTGATVLAKSSFITGDASGTITVAWDTGELDLDPGVYSAKIVATRTADATSATYARDLLIRES